MKEEGEKLPVVQKRKNLAAKRDRADFLRKAKRVGKGLGILFGGTTLAAFLSTIGVPIAPIVVFFGTALIDAKNLRDLTYKTEPSLMFYTQKSKDGTEEIYQDAFEYPGYLKEISISDKASIMGLQTLIWI